MRWKEDKIYFYDSFARVGGYATKLETGVRQLLRMCEVFFDVKLGVDELTWVGERVSCYGRCVCRRGLTNTAAACETNEQLGLRSIRGSGRFQSSEDGHAKHEDSERYGCVEKDYGRRDPVARVCGISTLG